MEPHIAINLLRGAQSIEEVEPKEESEDASRFRVIVDFEEAASDAPFGVSNLLALGDDEPILDAWDAAVEQSLPYRYTITSYGADCPVDGLVKRMNSESILVPEFVGSES
jgi:hypothetical protein